MRDSFSEFGRSTVAYRAKPSHRRTTDRHVFFEGQKLAEQALREQEKDQKVQSKVKEGQATVKTPLHPMVLTPVGTFLATPNEELFKNHEGMRDRGTLRFLDRVDDIAAFAGEGYEIVFFSYQWLSWTHKGPNGVQREWMTS